MLALLWLLSKHAFYVFRPLYTINANVQFIYHILSLTAPLVIQDEGNIQPKLEEEAESEDEEKMKEVTGSGELLSRVQDLEDKLEDSEQEKMALQNKLKTSQEEEGRLSQEIASLKEKLVSVVSSQVRRA